MVERRDSGRRGRPTRVLRALLLSFAALVLAGAGYQQWTQSWVKAQHPPPGRLIEVGGRTMHLHCTGSGSPTVVLEAGATGFAQSWAWVQKALSPYNRVCSYDRVGLGWSETGDAEPTGITAARNLRILLQKAGEGAPFVVVGHSMGGPLAQIFTGLYAEEVVGVVLIDPSHPEQMERYGAVARNLLDEFTQTLRVASWLSYTGVVRLTDVLAKHAQGLPREALLVARTFASSRKHLRASYQELEHWDQTMAAAKQFMDMRDRPLLVISATKGRSDFPQRYVEQLQVLHAELAETSVLGQHVRVAGADHFSLLTHRQHAAQTAQLIQTLILHARMQPWPPWPPETPTHRQTTMASVESPQNPLPGA